MPSPAAAGLAAEESSAAAEDRGSSNHDFGVSVVAVLAKIAVDGETGTRVGIARGGRAIGAGVRDLGDVWCGIKFRTK